MAPPHVFISHASQDIDVVKALAEKLKARGIDVWLDAWQMGTGDNFISHINAGLDQATAGLIVFSEHAHASPWVKAEVAYLAYAHTEEGKTVIPVVLKAEDRALVPPLLRPHIWGRIDDVDGIAKALRGDPAAPSPAPRPASPRNLERVTISLRRKGETGVNVEVQIGDQVYGTAPHDALPRDALVGQAEFRRGFRYGLTRDLASYDRTALDRNMADLGRALRELCLPGDSADALASLIDGCPLGTTIEVCVEADTPELLGLPLEALRLSDDRLLATQAPVVMLRRPIGVSASPSEPLAGPLKILVAVGAPDEDQAGGPALDLERELQTILDAVTLNQPAGQADRVQVRILEVGHPDVIGAAVEADPYHVLHLSCHGSPGALILEDEDGRAVRVTAAELLEPIRRAGRPLPLVLLSACHTGVEDESEQTASFAEALLQAGVPAVLATLTSVTDFYSTELARAFYQHLAHHERPLASRALAAARKGLEDARLKAIRNGAPLGQTQPEYATVSLFLAGEERQLADFTLARQPLTRPPARDLAGPVPQLRIDDLIGRRKELRETMRTLRDPNRQHAGVVLTGLGGVGKSAVAGRAMQRLAEDGWLVAAHAGRFDLAAIARALGFALRRAPQPELKQLGQELMDPNLDDQTRLSYVAEILAQVRVLLVLDDFEQNLNLGGGFLDPATGDYLATLAQNARQGRLLLTCRYPVPGTEALLHRVPIGPLSVAETRKLLRRLEHLTEALARDRTMTLDRLLRVIGGHPRMMELLDALLHGGRGRLIHVTQKLQTLLGQSGLASPAAGASLDEGLNGVRPNGVEVGGSGWTSP